MTTLRASQCIILTTSPMRTLCGKTDDSLAGITLATLSRLREINRNPQQPDIQIRLCPLCPRSGCAGHGNGGHRGGTEVREPCCARWVADGQYGTVGFRLTGR